jgi:hypothetical protein
VDVVGNSREHVALIDSVLRGELGFIPDFALLALYSKEILEDYAPSIIDDVEERCTAEFRMVLLNFLQVRTF